MAACGEKLVSVKVTQTDLHLPVSLLVKVTFVGVWLGVLMTSFDFRVLEYLIEQDYITMPIRRNFTSRMDDTVRKWIKKGVQNRN